jgi:hypothetical protein
MRRPSRSIHQRRLKGLLPVKIPEKKKCGIDGALVLTVDARLKSLSAHFAGEMPQSQLFVQFHNDRIFVVAKETRKCAWKGLSLSSSVSPSLDNRCEIRLPFWWAGVDDLTSYAYPRRLVRALKAKIDESEETYHTWKA